MINLITQYIEKHVGSGFSSFEELSEFLTGMYIRRSTVNMPDMVYSPGTLENGMGSLLRILYVEKISIDKHRLLLFDSTKII